ncbi:MAG TPA: L-seryl-tRNA(Sec) selenium transferase [Terriglobales bacterium]|nr:L-seryl-tRNA(Sec) selenium transferase [Terriglobales bacterium]
MKTAAKSAERSALYRKLPAVDELLRAPEVAALEAREGHAAVAEAARAVLATLRQEIAAGRLDAAQLELALSGLAPAVERRLRQSLSFSLRPVINATGVVLHTNLGRAPLAEQALERMRTIATAYSNLEFDLEAGERGRRDAHADRLFARLLNREGVRGVSTLVVNNNAAAVLLALNTLGEGGEVIVSRGELVEIGGSFRIPDVMARSGALLREVGTTNRTRLSDYARAIGKQTRALLRVHRSNFQIVGFTEQPLLADLVKLARKHKLPLVEDLGSGALVEPRALGLAGEPSVWDSLRAGVDVVTYSGDKLLGGPQAGLLSGKKDVVARLRANPLFRALRVDKLTYAALEVTLTSYLRQDHDAIPALRMMRLSAEEIGKRAQALAQKLRVAARLEVTVIPGESVVGGGAAPGTALPTVLLAVSCAGLSADALAARLRAAEPPVIARVEEGRVLLDLRTVFPQQDELVARALARVAG